MNAQLLGREVFGKVLVDCSELNLWKQIRVNRNTVKHELLNVLKSVIQKSFIRDSFFKLNSVNIHYMMLSHWTAGEK